jgi:glycosyltransferase involved in cell wall biosynthesis
MACEVVPIATRVGGVPEVIDDGETGFLADVGDVETMARCAIEVLSDRTKLSAMANLGRKRARERFCASKIIPQYEKFYQSVIDRSK